MKTKHLGIQTLLGIATLCPALLATPVVAQVSVQVAFPAPPPIVFAAPPVVVVLPGFNIYVAPDIAEEVYFVDGFWWRPWQGRWYRSQYYDRGWDSYSSVPSFYGSVHQGWRDDYRNHRWQGEEWNYERMPHQRVEQNWSSWKSSNYWQGQKNWGVPNMKGKHAGRDHGPAAVTRSQHDTPDQRPGNDQAGRPKTPPSPHREAAPRKSSQSKRMAAPPSKTSSRSGGGEPRAQKQHSPASGGNSKASSHGGGGKDKGKPASKSEGGKDKH
jgi:hypothetical protein